MTDTVAHRRGAGGDLRAGVSAASAGGWDGSESARRGAVCCPSSAARWASMSLVFCHEGFWGATYQRLLDALARPRREGHLRLGRRAIGHPRGRLLRQFHG
jgi:hypothetical protein